MTHDVYKTPYLDAQQIHKQIEFKCKQEKPMNEMNIVLNRLVDSMERQELTLTKVVDNQEQVKVLIERDSRREKDIAIIFERIRIMETTCKNEKRIEEGEKAYIKMALKLEGLYVKVTLIVAISSMLAVLIGNYIIKHLG